MGFQWDPEKEEINVRKHGISFKRAAPVLLGHYFRREDRRYDYGESRWIAIGAVRDDILAIVFTERGADIRIISARKARRDERKIYEEFSKQAKSGQNGIS